MKRHINRKHTRAVGKRAFQSGKCLCLECGHRCFRIKDLRKHLSTEHGVIFKTEILQMQNAKTWKADTEEKEGCSFVKVTDALLEESGNPRKYNKGSLSRQFTCTSSGQRKKSLL
ncbi:unnamed protein product [Pocillopora meandrina]|uniref:C2H2-type domain-containing protein n=1 Tax=Pocillopora meandrina TaxID=46732 RepID=A0AAU9X125_9CNID|nr:unnamed protein product [Pocillopora meandrina]